MTAIYVDRDTDDYTRRKKLYDGELFVYSPSAATKALCSLARELAEQLFSPYDPRDAQHHLSVEKYVDILAKLKPEFIHHPQSRQLIREILDERGCDLLNTYFDLPRLRVVTSDGYLTSGLGYAFKPHRDTWYSTPRCQINWWLPVYSIESDNAMAFHMRYWDNPLMNSSAEFNYQDWNRVGRRAAPKQVGIDTRKQSEALEPVELEPDLRVVSEPDGLLMFSAAHLHSTVPNTSGYTRMSIDFRTVHLDELADDDGAPNLDGESTGTTIRDYVRGTDFTLVPELIRANFETRQPAEDELPPQLRST
jgi:hypothetical protein